MTSTVSHPYGTRASRETVAKVALMQQLAQTIQRLERVLVKIKEAHHALEEDLKHLRVAPIHQLPPELLSNIFLFACQGGIDHETMTTIPLVCRKWRDLLNNTPRIWTQIDVRISHDVTHSRKQCERARLYAERSKNLKLDVKIDLSNVASLACEIKELIMRTYDLPDLPREIMDNDDEGGTQFDGAFLDLYRDMLIDLTGEDWEFARRWRSLSLMSVEDFDSDVHLPRWIDPIFIDILRLDMPFLSHLTISGIMQPLNDLLEQSESLNLPAITSFSLERGYSLVPFSLSGTGLSTLWIEDRIANRNLSHLGQFRGLKDLTYVTDASQDMSHVSLSPIYLPVLDKLVLIGSFRPIVIALFDAPNLRILVLKLHSYQGGSYMEAKIYSQPSIVRLLIPYHDIPRARGFFEFLLPQLTSAAHIYINEMVEDILIEVTKKIKEEQPRLLPSLTAVYQWDIWPSDRYTLIYQVPKSNEPPSS